MEPKEIEIRLAEALENMGSMAEAHRRLVERLEALEEENRLLRARLEALELHQRLRPASGVHVGIVQGSKAGEPAATDSLGRVKIKLAWDGRAHEMLAKVATAWLSKSAGVQWLPRVGEAVYVAFEEADPARPVIIGCVPNPTNPLPYDPVSTSKSPTAAEVKDKNAHSYRPSSANKYKNLWRTASADGTKINEIALVDDPEACQLSIATDGQLLISAKDKGFFTINEDYCEYVGGDKSLRVKGETTEIYEGKRKVEYLNENHEHHHVHSAEWHWGDVEELFLGSKVEMNIGSVVEGSLQGGVGVKSGAFVEVTAGDLVEAFTGAKQGVVAGTVLEASFGSATHVINGVETTVIDGAGAKIVNGSETIVINGLALEVVDGIKEVDHTVRQTNGELSSEAVAIHTGEFSIVSQEKVFDLMESAVSIAESALHIIE